jgi:RND family efflux transporter MFP subunit
MNYESRLDQSDLSDRVILTPDGEEVRGGKRRWLWVGLALALVAAVAGWFFTREDEPTAFAVDNSTAPAVTVLAPGNATVEGAINATGTLAARRQMPVGVVGEGGRVLSVSVEPGDWVRAGQVLAVIDRSVQTQQTANQAALIDVAIADANLAQANLDRALRLVDRGFISTADVDRLTATRDAADARVRVARAQLGERQARNAQLNVVAPAAGLVLERNVEPGQVVGSGSGVLFAIARGGEMELVANLSEDDLARVSPGATGVVTPVGLGETFNCQVWQVAPIIDATTRQGSVRCAMSYAPELRPGGFASVRLVSGSVVAPLLPESALLNDDRGHYVYIVGENNTVVRRPVEVGQITDSGITIASGLSGREMVVLRAGGFLSEGETIRPVRETQPD